MRRLVLLTIVCVAAILFTTSVVAVHLYVSPEGDDAKFCRPSANACKTIARAMDVAIDDDIINVNDGIYDERLVISKRLTLNGSGVNAIVRPSSTPTEGVYDIEIDAGGTIIQNFQFDFNGPDDARGGQGIVVCDMDEPPVTNVRILGNIIYTGDGSGVGGTGIQTGKNCDVSGLIINENTFYGDESGMGEGVYVNPYPGSGIVTIDNNEFRGYLFSGVSIEASNVLVKDNIINSDASKGKSGIRFLDANPSMVPPQPAQTFSNVQISSNNIQNVEYGIRVGIGIDAGSSLTATITSNTLTNNDVGIWARHGANLGASVHNNSITGNTNYGINNEGLNEVNAEYNWWGAADGPSPNQGSGDRVSSNIDFDPWWADIAGFLTGTEESVAAANCDDQIDNDLDLGSDCADPDCEGYGTGVSCGTGACTGTMVCQSGQISCSTDWDYCGTCAAFGCGAPLGLYAYKFFTLQSGTRVCQEGACSSSGCMYDSGVCADTVLNDQEPYTSCGAGCDTNSDCAHTECDSLDICYSGRQRDYHDVANDCLPSCFCDSQACEIFDYVGTDNDLDGYDAGCGDCNDSDIELYPGALELCDGRDNDCDSLVDEDYPLLGQECTAGEGDCSITGSYVCTIDLMDVECDAQPKEDLTPCSDGFFCTHNEHCLGGVCTNGVENICDDAVGCTEDSCDEGIDSCVHSANHASCGDGLFCNGDEVCDLEFDCQSGSPIVCSPNNIPGVVGCKNNPDNVSYTWDYRLDFISICQEPGICTTGDDGISHDCSIYICDADCESNADCSGNFCFQIYSDRCNGTKLVDYLNNRIFDGVIVTDSCENSCYSNCTCTDCVTNCSMTPVTQCVVPLCNALCDSDDDCQVTDCDGSDGCIGPDYYDYNDMPNSCLGSCSCAQNACTEYTVFTGDVRCGNCITESDCNYLDKDYCDGGLVMRDEGVCVNWYCQASQSITENCDNLDTNQCLGTSIVHHDYGCESAACVLESETPIEDCDNRLFCDGQEACADASCIAGSLPDCSDLVSCTDGRCDEENDACMQTANDSRCNDNIDCTSDICDSDLGCQYTANDALCDDNLFCNGNEACGINGCHSGTPPDCMDSIACTDDSCDESNDICANVPNDANCNDNVGCTVDTCDQLGGCQFAALDSNCDDSLWCNGFEACDSLNGCMPGVQPDCADNIACTVDSCNEFNDSCRNSAENSLCDDGLACNGIETCETLGGCQEGVSVVCSHNDVAGIQSCENVPDNNSFTWDYRNSFVSQCVEPGVCLAGNEAISHSCNISACNAECEQDGDCAANSCAVIYHDYCDAKKLVEYDYDRINDSTLIADTCTNNCFGNCTCENCSVDCSPPQKNSYCVQGLCGAECDTIEDCSSMCADDTYYFNSSCKDDCTCNYEAQDCNEFDEWHDIGQVTWVEFDQCNEKEVVEQEYRNYTCSAGCMFSVAASRLHDTGNRRPKFSGTSCEADGSLCTLDQCNSTGSCVSNDQVDCAYLDSQCQDGACNPADGSCYANYSDYPISTACELDQDLCTIDHCDGAGSCALSHDVACIDPILTDCIYPACNATTGGCNVIDNVADDTACNDSLFCTWDDKCLAGQCAGQKRWCNDNIICTADVCDENSDVCINTVNNTFCSDGNECTGDVCNKTSMGCQNPPLPSGTLCGQSQDCLENYCNNSFAQIYTADGHDSCDSQGTCSLYQCSMLDSYCCDDDPDDGINGLLCAAECDQHRDCIPKCQGSVYHFNGSCSNVTCGCSYQTQDCDTLDRWYNRNAYQWVSYGQCQEIRQREQEYRNYSCSGSGCSHVVTKTRWRNLSTMRNNTDGTFCNDGLFCTDGDSCIKGACLPGPARGCSDGVGCTVDICNESADSCVNSRDDSFCDDGLWCNGIEACDAVNDCQPGIAPDCNDNVSCTVDSCDEAFDRCSNFANNTFCSNGLFCDGQETCHPVQGCINGNVLSCAAYDITEIGSCNNNPDNMPLTWDYRQGFRSSCTEVPGNYNCTQGSLNITHTCDIQQCGAGCAADSDCGMRSCDHRDGCFLGKYRNFTDVSKVCTDCACQNSPCTTYLNEEDDADNDGYDEMCGDCNDANASISPLAFEACDGIDNNCNGTVDEIYSPEVCHAKCTYLGYQWTGNGNDLNCCGNNASEARPYETREASCWDAMDNDCDGLIDCLDSDCTGSVGPAGAICCQVKSDCPGADAVCKRCTSNHCSPRPATYNCSGVLLCSGSGGGDGSYGSFDYRAVRTGYCDGVGNCDSTLAAGPVCDLGKYAAAEGLGINMCWDGISLCRDTCFDGVDNDNDACVDGTDSDCGGTEADCFDNLDNDCDGLADMFDLDCEICNDLDGDGHFLKATLCLSGTDCNDTDSAIYFGAPELCDGKDNDCDNVIDEAAPTSAVVLPAGGIWRSTDFQVSVADQFNEFQPGICEYRVLSMDLGLGWVVTKPWTTRQCNSAVLVSVGPYSDCKRLGRNNCRVDVRAKNSIGCAGTVTTALFSIDWLAPTVRSIRPASGSSTSDATPEVAAGYGDRAWSGINTSSVRLFLDGIDVTGLSVITPSQAMYLPSANMAEGNHMVVVRVMDNLGHLSELAWSFKIDLTNPSIQVLQPAQGSNSSKSAVLSEVELDETVRYLRYSVDGRRFSTLCRDCGYLKKSMTFSDGLHDLTFEAEDYAGNTQHVSVQFFVDSKKPQITETLPAENSFVGGTTFSIKYTEDNLQKVVLYWRNETATSFKSFELSGCASGRNKKCSVDMDFSSYEGGINYYFELYDPASVVRSGQKNIVVDNTGPTLDIISPTPGIYSSRYANLLAMSTEPVKSMEYSVDGGRFTTLCTNCNSGARRIYLSYADHTINVWATDYAGNTGQSGVTIGVQKVN